MTPPHHPTAAAPATLFSGPAWWLQIVLAWLLLLLALAMAALGVQLLALGGSAYYLLAGVAALAGALLVFVDADTQVDAPLLQAALDALASGAVGGGCRVALEGPRPWPLRLAVRLVGLVFRYTGIAPGCFLFCTREAFDAVGGFDTTLFAGEDVALSRALARHGRFVILRQAVQTSGRKLAHASTWMQLRLLWRFARQGTRMLRSREELALWYGGPEGRAPR